MLEVFAKHQAGQAPRVKLTKAPTRDFDGDGFIDDQDTAPVDPAVH